MAHRSRSAPKVIVLIFLAALALQLAYGSAKPRAVGVGVDFELPSPPSALGLQVLSANESLAMAKLATLWLQVFDTAAGHSASWSQLNYAHLVQWLERLVQLDPNAQYPLLAATHLYGEVADLEKSRAMLDFVYARFQEAPGKRWRWLAEATVLAKHKLHDLPLALKYANALADTPKEPAVPSWARQLKWIILEDLGEVESARVVVGGLIESGEITDQNELRFLSETLRRLEQKHSNSAL